MNVASPFGPHRLAQAPLAHGPLAHAPLAHGAFGHAPLGPGPHATKPRRGFLRWWAVLLVVVAATAAILGLLALWIFSDQPTPSTLRIQTRAEGAPCESVDLELDLDAGTARVRQWQAQPGNLCVARVTVETLTPDQTKRARAAATDVVSAGVVRALIEGERRPGEVKLSWGRKGENLASEVTRTFRGVRPYGTGRLERLHAELAAQRPAAPAAQNPQSTSK